MMTLSLRIAAHLRLSEMLYSVGQRYAAGVHLRSAFRLNGERLRRMRGMH